VRAALVRYGRFRGGVHRGPLTPALLRLLVGPQPLKARLPQEIILRPFTKGDFGHEARLDPMHIGPPRQVPVVKRTALLAQLIQAPAQIEQGLVRETGTDLAGINQPLAVIAVVADEQGAEADARPLRIGEAADHELLAADAFDLQPPVTARLKVRTVPLLS